MYLNIYIAMMILFGLIFSVIMTAVSKDQNPRHDLSHTGCSCVIGILAGAIWPLSLIFFVVGFLSEWGSEWILKKAEGVE